MFRLYLNVKKTYEIFINIHEKHIQAQVVCQQLNIRAAHLKVII